MSPELSNNIIHTIYLTFTHNQAVIAYFIGFIISVFLSILKPNRFNILTLLGFLTLAVGYEYDKHFVGPFVRQTLQSIVLDPSQNTRTAKFINLFLGEIMPVIFYIVGWGFIFVAMIIGTKVYGRKIR